MKTKDLIQALMSSDPSGEMECCVNNKDILYIRKEPAHYGGALEILIRSGNKFHDIVGAKMTIFGDKLQIAAAPIKELMLMNAHLTVETDAKYLEDQVNTWKEYYGGK